MAKLEEKYTYEIHMEKTRQRIQVLKDVYTSIKEDFIQLELKMQRVNELMQELDSSEFEIEIMPIKKEKKKSLWGLKNLLDKPIFKK